MRVRFTPRKYAVILILVATIFVFQGIDYFDGTFESTESTVGWSSYSTADENRTVIDFLSINGNAQFHQVAAQYDWPGSGMEWDPYIIEGYLFNNTYHQFTVTGTDLYWELRNNILDGVDDRWCQIVISNLRNAKISNNIFMRGSVGIHCIRVNDSMFVGNTMSEHSFDGVFLEYSHRNIIASNTFYNEGEGGVLAWTDSTQNTFRNNRVYDSAYGILLWHQAHGNTLRNNIIHHTSIMGMDIQTNDNTIAENQIHHVDGHAICIGGTSNAISDNVIYNNTGCGANVATTAGFSTIANNIFINCEDGGTQLHEAAGCVVSENDFFENGFIQATDYGDGNVFDHNYWHEWIGNDTNEDNIIDFPKSIYGGESTDQRPALEPINAIPAWYTYEPITGPPDETVTTTTTSAVTTTTTTGMTTTSSSTTTVQNQFDTVSVWGVLGTSGALIIIALLIMKRQMREA